MPSGHLATLTTRLSLGLFMVSLYTKTNKEAHVKVLVTGGTGYIGSHTVVELLAAGHEVVIVDNYVNSKPEVLNRLKQITGQDVPFYKGDVTDQATLENILGETQCEAIIHFAAYKAVGESVEKPLEYYRNNLDGTIAVAGAALAKGVSHVVFSSSCTVYGDPKVIPVTEDTPQSATNPYGYTKLMSEQILRDAVLAHPELKVTLLRYFNPIGAHASGLIGEDPNGIPNNLVPFVAQVAVGKRDKVMVFGNDYPTPDGTGIRDYIHVVDLAKGHIAALEYAPKTGVADYNLGTGHGSSVLQVVKAFEQASGKTIAYEVAPRRAGDIAETYASTAKAEQELGWKAELDLAAMCRDSWNWQSKNPNGFK